MDGWKMNSLFGMAQFQGRTVSFRGVGVFLNHFFWGQAFEFYISLRMMNHDLLHLHGSFYFFALGGGGRNGYRYPPTKIPQNGKHDQERWSVNWRYSCMVDARLPRENLFFQTFPPQNGAFWSISELQIDRVIGWTNPSFGKWFSGPL